MKDVLLHILWLGSLAAAQSSSQHSIITLTGSDRRLSGEGIASVTVPSDFNGSSIATTSISGSISSGTLEPNATSSIVSSEDPITRVGGDVTATTSAPPRPSNTQPCNNYPEFCTRRYSNITEVCAHNSPFVRQNNAGSNQQFDVTTQLNDGIRVLQGQAHMVNGTLYYCHTSCDLLNAGTVEDYLRTVTQWVETHPFDVITIIFGNFDWQQKYENGSSKVTARDYVAPLRNSGLQKYIFQPPNTAMTLEDWPTLGEMIISGKRVVTFIDYNADTDAVPWLLWQFYNVWETPFSPTNISFPCNVDRPSGISDERARDMMYMANHNLNTEISIPALGVNLLVPNVATLDQTNGVNGTGSLGLMSEECTEDWSRPPNFLLVDYYNHGDPNGSVFEVAARANEVTYTRKCCGTESLAGSLAKPQSATFMGLAVAVAAALML